MRFKNTDVWGFEHAIRGCRNPLESWNKSDSKYNYDSLIGKNDMDLMQRLIKGGSEHRKFMRQIFVSVDITAPSYFMAELDTYKIGVTRNSTSFMHKGISKEFEIEDFEIDDPRIIEILSTRKIKEKNPIFYPYETDEFKIYTMGNGRAFEVYKNGRIFCCPYDVIDSTGKLKGRTRHFERKELQPSINSNGYYELNIGGRDGEKWLLHRLVAHVWCENANNFDTVDHINGDKTNNCAENLEWVSREENIKRGFENNLMRRNNYHANYLNWKISSKLDPSKKLKIRKEYQESQTTYKKLANKYNVSITAISAAINNYKNSSDNNELFEFCWYWEEILKSLNMLRDKYLETKDFTYFRMIRQLLPHGYLYTSTITMSYENVYNICHQRKGHKLSEWQRFIEWAETLPYAKELIFLEKEN